LLDDRSLWSETTDLHPSDAVPFGAPLSVSAVSQS
jgi:hypothetical protein